MNNPIYTAKNYSLLLKHGERGKNKSWAEINFLIKNLKINACLL